MQIGVSSYSYTRLIQSGVLSEIDVVAKAAEMGFKALEFAGLNPSEGESPLAYASRLRAACADAGVAIVNYAVTADFLTGSGGDLATEIERVKQEVLVAEALGAPKLRHDVSTGFSKEHGGPATFDAALPRLAEACRIVTEFAEGKGIRTMVENHGYFCQDSSRIENLLITVDHPNFGLLLDTGNFACVDEDCAAAVGRLAPHAVHVHVKDFHRKSGMLHFPGEGWFRSRAGNFLRGAILGHGELPLFQCLLLLQRAGYDGALSIEFEGMEDPLEGIRLGYEHLKTLLVWLRDPGI